MATHVDAYLDALRPWEGAYFDVRVCYLAVKLDDGFRLIQAHVESLMMQLPIAIPRFETSKVLGGQFLLSQIKMDLAQFLHEANLGRLHTPDGMVAVARSPTPDFMTAEFNTEFLPLSPEGTGRQGRMAKLTLNAGPTPQGNDAFRTELDWEVRAADTPFDGLVDLAAALGLVPANLTRALVTATAPAPAAIDAARSIVSGGKAQIVCRLSNNLAPEDFTLGYRIVKVPLTTLSRATIPGTDLEWGPSENPHFNSGRISIDVPEGAIIQCFANIRGVVQHFFWVADPNVFLNPQRTILETYDPQLTAMKAAIFDNGRRGGGDARQLEVAVTWLLWMLGFIPAHLGTLKQLEDGPDIIAATPQRNYVVVECTTGMLKADKLAKLVERRSTLLERLKSSGAVTARVIAAIVTSLRRADVAADLEHAERLGITVLTREDVEQAISRTVVPQNADSYFDEAEKSIKAGLERRGTFETL